MLWIDDVLNDLQKFCDDQGYPQIKEKLEETRRVYHKELQESYCIEFPPKSSSLKKAKSPRWLSETSKEFQRRPRLVHSKP